MALDVNSAGQLEEFCNRLKRFLLAVSWGGHESLAFPVCAGMPTENFDASNVEHKLVRFYIGLEDPNVLLKDIEQSLESI